MTLDTLDSHQILLTRNACKSQSTLKDTASSDPTQQTPQRAAPDDRNHYSSTRLGPRISDRALRIRASRCKVYEHNDFSLRGTGQDAYRERSLSPCPACHDQHPETETIVSVGGCRFEQPVTTVHEQMTGPLTNSASRTDRKRSLSPDSSPSQAPPSKHQRVDRMSQPVRKSAGKMPRAVNAPVHGMTGYVPLSTSVCKMAVQANHSHVSWGAPRSSETQPALQSSMTETNSTDSSHGNSTLV